MISNGDKPANPVPWEGFDEYMSGIAGGSNYGLTKREYFAAMAMHGILSSQHNLKNVETSLVSVISQESINYAEGLLKALEENNE